MYLIKVGVLFAFCCVALLARRKPFDRDNAHPRRQLAPDARRLARIARIFPVDVPAFFEVKEEAMQGLVSRRNGLIIGNEFDRSVRYL